MCTAQHTNTCGTNQFSLFVSFTHTVIYHSNALLLINKPYLTPPLVIDLSTCKQNYITFNYISSDIKHPRYKPPSTRKQKNVPCVKQVHVESQSYHAISKWPSYKTFFFHDTISKQTKEYINSHTYQKNSTYMYKNIVLHYESVKNNNNKKRVKQNTQSPKSCHKHYMFTLNVYNEALLKQKVCTEKARVDRYT